MGTGVQRVYEAALTGHLSRIANDGLRSSAIISWPSSATREGPKLSTASDSAQASGGSSGRRAQAFESNPIINCECCGVPQRATFIPGEPDPTRCGICWQHRAVNQVEERALAHEVILRERLERARSYADEQRTQRDRYEEKVHHAYGARERALRLVARVRDLHALNGRGACSCGLKRGCRVAELLQEPWVSRQLAISERIDAEPRAELRLATPQRSEWLVGTLDDLDRSGPVRGAGAALRASGVTLCRQTGRSGSALAREPRYVERRVGREQVGVDLPRDASLLGPSHSAT